MGSFQRVVLTALPKLFLSRATGLLARVRLPRFLRRPVLGCYSWCFGVDREAMSGQLQDYESLAVFFQRPLEEGARPIADGAAWLWPCDGRVITTGKIQQGRIPQVKGRDYGVDQLLQDEELAAGLTDGHQLTVYLAPGDYHRVHSPFGGEITKVVHLPGKLFPVHPRAVDSIPELFPRNERAVFHYRLEGGLPAAVVMVSALNVGDTTIIKAKGPVAAGDEIGRFGFGSTVVVLVPGGGPTCAELERGTVVRMGQGVP
jgi:phosphatidylserine decarboxylase